MKKTAVLFSFLIILSVVFPLVGCGGKSTRTYYEIACELSDYTLSGTETVDFYNSSDNVVTELKFNLFGNAFRNGAKYSPIAAQYTSRAYPNGLSYGDTSVSSVKSEGKNLEFSVGGEDENILYVKLAEELFPEERVKVELDFELNLANVVARTGYNAHTVNLANFYPILCALDENGFYECVYYSNGDPFYSDCADYKVTLTADNDYVIAASGKIQSVSSVGEKSVRTYAIENARSFAFVLCREFEAVTDVSTGAEISYYYYADENPLQSLEYAVKSFSTFCDKFGDYPYPVYSVVQTEFIQGGMEFPGLVMISDNLEPAAYGEVIVHETAHQWWQSVVGNNEIEYGFLDEGLAEYSTVLFYESYPEYGYTREKMIKSSENTYKVFCSVYDKIFGNANTVMLRSLKDFSSEYEYVNMAYVKPCIMYDYLRETIGEDKFFKGLKNYYERYKFKNAVPDDLAGVFEKTGADTNGFFKSFFEGKVII